MARDFVEEFYGPTSTGEFLFGERSWNGSSESNGNLLVNGMIKILGGCRPGAIFGYIYII